MCSDNVMGFIALLDRLDAQIDQYPPEDMGTQRFGNKAFRKWHERLVKVSEC
jgi:hypothetical protein